MLTWVRQIPIGASLPTWLRSWPTMQWRATSRVPKLFVRAEPGALLAGGANLDFARGLPTQAEVTVAGVHYLQEDSPNDIGRAVAGWMAALRRRSRRWANGLRWANGGRIKDPIAKPF